MANSDMIPQDPRILKARLIATTARANEEVLRLNVPHQPLAGSKARVTAAYPLAGIRMSGAHVCFEGGVAGESL
jgi:hypothetical protein